MPLLKIGVELAAFRLPLKQALHTAAELGADAVEIDARGEITPKLSRTGVRQLRKMLEDLRLRVSALRFRTRRGYDAAAELDRRVAATKAAMQLAYDLGAPVVINHIGRVPPLQQSDSRRQLLGVLEELGRHGHRVGALLAAQTGTESGEELAGLLANLPAGAVGVDLNPGNLILNGFSPLDAVAALGDSILHVHATDANLNSPGRPGDPAPLGQGSADFPALLAALDEHDYHGYFTVGHQTIDDPRAEIARAIEYLRGL